MEKKESKALDICALVFGILSIVGCCCCFGIWGVVGLILSIIALAKGRRSGILIAGFICSIIGLLASIFWMVFFVTPVGNELKKEFMEGFKEGFESTYNGPDLNAIIEEEIDDADVEWQDSMDSDMDKDADGQDSVDIDTDDDWMGAMHNDFKPGNGYDEVTVAGTKITIPCTFGDIRDQFTFDLGEGLDLESNWNAEEINEIYGMDAEGNRAFGLWVQNKVALEELNQEKIFNLWFSNSMDLNPENVEFFDGIKIGMSGKELKDKLDGYKTKMTGENGIEIIEFLFEGDGTLHYTIYISDDVVTEISITSY